MNKEKEKTRRHCGTEDIDLYGLTSFFSLCLRASVFLFLTAITQPIFSQCCSPGNPLGGANSLGVNTEDSWQLFVNYRYGYSGKYFEGNRPSETQFIRNGNFNYLGLIAAFGLTDRLTLEAETGFFINKTQSYVEGIIPEKLIGNGLTDLNLLARFSFWKDPVREMEFNSGIGIKIPLGSYQKKYQGALLTRDLQPTTGSYDFVHTAFFYKGFLPQKLRLFIANRIEIKGNNPDQYRYGNFWTTSAFLSYSSGPRWIFVGQIRTEFRGRDSRPLSGNGIPVDNERELVLPSGSQKLFLVPQISFAFSTSTYLSLLADIPVYQYYNDKQLANTMAITLSFRKVFEKTGL